VIGALAFFVQPLLTLGFCFVGAILMLFALHGLADYYKEKGIFSNGLYGFIALIGGSIVTFAGFFYLFFYTTDVTNLLSKLYPGFNGDWSTLPNLTANTNLNPAEIVPFISPILAVLVVAWIFIIIAAFFTWRSVKDLSSKSKVGLFSTAGLLLLVGAIIPLLGLILMWISILLMAFAFFQIKPQPEQQAAIISSPPPTI
ncbi:MAG TPA: DUF996 domain-containing protein, partial [Candidatus Bathyarchaeia archaeon]